MKSQELEWWQQENLEVMVNLDHTAKPISRQIERIKRNPMGTDSAVCESQGILLVYMFKNHVKR